jgi:predicted DsbA family dithiol-disulfide isomerase
MRIEVWSDVVCPWCWLGNARLKKAVAAFEHRDEVEVVFRSFELDPKRPKDLDIPTTDVLVRKFGMPRAQIDALHGRLRAWGAADGIDFQFDKVRTSNTFEAHELTHLARVRGVQSKMTERLFRANFSEGVRIGDKEELVRLAGEVGLDAAEAEEVLADGRYASSVRQDEEQARALGISGVPFFLAERKLAVSGAQSVDVLRGMLDAAWDHRTGG